MTATHPRQDIGVSLVGIGAYVPESIITNDDLTRLVDTSDEWIATRTGIRQRHVVSGDETVAGLSIRAAQDALESAGMTADEIDLLIVATSTPDTIYPGTACQVQHAIGATRAAGFDLAIACSGFVFGTVTAYQYLKTGTYRTAMIIGADIHSRFVDWSDRNTCVLFADGAGAAIYKAEPGAEDNILAFDLNTDGSKGKELLLSIKSDNCPLVEKRSDVSQHLYMNGREMFKFAVGVVPESIHRVLKNADVKLDDVDFLVLHQANIRIMQAMSEKLALPPEKLISNVDHIGNTSAASIPIALNEAVLKGQIRAGHRLILCGFGAGVAWGSTLMNWTCVDKRTEKMAAIQKAEKELAKT